MPVPFPNKVPQITYTKFEYFNVLFCFLNWLYNHEASPRLSLRGRTYTFREALRHDHTGLYSRSQSMRRNPTCPKAAPALPWTHPYTNNTDASATSSYSDILDDLLHQYGIGQHVSPEGSVLQQQAEQLANHWQLLRSNSVHPQALQHQPEDSRQESQDGDTGAPQLVPTTMGDINQKAQTHAEKVTFLHPPKQPPPSRKYGIFK